MARHRMCSSLTYFFFSHLFFKINYCLMQVKSIAECLTYIKLPFVFKNFILSIFEWLLKTDLTVNVILVFIVSSSNESSDN